MYHSTQYEEALMRLLYTIKAQKGAAMLTGEIGCGKTTVSRAFVQELSGNDYEIGIIANPSMASLDFLKVILYQLGIEKTAGSKSELLRILNDAILQNAFQKKKTILIIDDAQAIEDVTTYEELRLLLNFQFNNQFLLTLILIGRPELRDKIAKIPQMDSRISIRGLPTFHTVKNIIRLNDNSLRNKFFIPFKYTSFRNIFWWNRNCFMYFYLFCLTLFC